MIFKLRSVAIAVCLYVLVKRLLLHYRRSRMVILHKVPPPEKYKCVVQAFESNFAEGRELGAQVTCFVNGKPVIDSSGARDSESICDLTMVFSSTKVLESLAVAILVDQGKLKYEDPISKHWPEFGQVFSSTTTVAQLMRHEAGLDQIHGTIGFAQAKEIFTTSPEALKQWLLRTMKQRGNGQTRYHAVTRGFYVDVLCSICDGRRIREFIHEEIIDKLQDKHTQFTLGAMTPEINARMAECIADRSTLQLLMDMMFAGSGIASVLRSNEDDPDYVLDYELKVMYEFAKGLLLGVEYSTVVKSFAVFNEGREIYELANHPKFRTLPLSSMMGCTNAYTLARVGQELALGGGELISNQALLAAYESYGEKKMDEILHLPVEYTQCGWGRGRFRDGWIGWDGAGGSLFVWSPKHKASFAYVPTRMDVRLHRARGLRMLNAFIDALEE